MLNLKRGKVSPRRLVGEHLAATTPTPSSSSAAPYVPPLALDGNDDAPDLGPDATPVPLPPGDAEDQDRGARVGDLDGEQRAGRR